MFCFVIVTMSNLVLALLSLLFIVFIVHCSLFIVHGSLFFVIVKVQCCNNIVGCLVLRCTNMQVCIVQVGHAIELDTVSYKFEP